MNISTIDITILVLAVWRLASLLADEDGPFKFLEQLRTWMGIVVTVDPNGVEEHEAVERPTDGRFVLIKLYYATKKTVADGMLCRWCSSVWFGIIFTAIYLIWPGIVWVALPLALSTLSIMVDAAITNWYRRRR